MALLDVHFFSACLNVQVSALVILPEPRMGIGITAAGAERPPQVLYLLHGYSDDHTIWLRRTSVERYAAQKQLAVIMPAVNHSFYTNEAQGERYWDFVSQELPQVMHRFFRLSDRSEDAYVCGLSMGGYGAMKLALTFPERFAAAASFSGVLDVADMTGRSDQRIAVFERIFGDVSRIRGSQHDLLTLLNKQRTAPHRPRLYVACGTDDFLYAHHGRFCTVAEKCGWEITHQETPGFGHDWAYWDMQVKRFIQDEIR